VKQLSNMHPGESTTKSFPGTAAMPPDAPISSAAGTLADVRNVTAPARRNQGYLQWGVAGVLAALTALIVVRLAMVDGLLRSVSIDGPSMAPAFAGANYRVTCDDCRFVFRCDATNVPGSGLAVCPNCGYGENHLTANSLQPGEQVLIDRWKHLGREPKRGEVVAARLTSSPGELVVKRIAALPGEQLEIRGGDLYIDGQIVRKSITELREVRVLVHDHAFAPQKTPDLPPRWQAANSPSKWEGQGHTFEITATADDFDWLEYHHWRCTESSAPRTQAVPILDNDSFNQNLSRQLNPVTDVLLSCRVKATGDGPLALAVIDGSERFEVHIEPKAQRVALLQNGRRILQQPLGINLSRHESSIEFGLCDQQVLLAVAGRTVFLRPYERQGAPQSDVLNPLVIGARDMTATISGLRVWRDLYYLEPLDTPRPWKADQPLASGQFALLGDNPPASIDFRRWPGGRGVSQADILGPVTRPCWGRAE
jgi:hypothetical protein